MKKFIFWIILILLVYGSIEFSAFLGLYVLESYKNINYEPVGRFSSFQKDLIHKLSEEEYPYLSFHPFFGWTIKENGEYESYKANAAGIRANREYDPALPDKKVRIATFGDSFTHCDGVGNNETWQFFMEQLRKDLEVINFGVGAYGLDQTYLRYLKKGQKYKSHYVFIGFMAENIFRTVNTFRPFYQVESALPLSKPRYTIKENELCFMPNLMQTVDDYKTLLERPRETLENLGTYDYFYQNRYKSGGFDWSPMVRLFKILKEKLLDRIRTDKIIKDGVYNENAEAVEVTKKLFDVFYSAVSNNDATPIIVLFPQTTTYDKYRRYGITEYQPLISHFESKKYRYIDLIKAFEAKDKQGPLDYLVSKDNLHFSPYANKLIAQHIIDYLDKHLLRDNHEMSP